MFKNEEKNRKVKLNQIRQIIAEGAQVNAFPFLHKALFIYLSSAFLYQPDIREKPQSELYKLMILKKKIKLEKTK